VGNEATARPDQTLVAPYIKASAHDTKAYMISKSYREIPIGYAAADIESLRPMLQNYLACCGDSSENIDFLA
jgi:1,3-beta-glucanosyltransferase GAS1